MAYLKPQSPLKNNDDYIYPLTTADQVIMEDGSRLNTFVKEETITEAKTYTNQQITDRIIYGKGKNLLKNTAKNRTYNGLTLTVNDDGSVTLNGTAANTAIFVIGYISVKANTNYICTSGNDLLRYSFRLEDGNTVVHDFSANNTYTPDSDNRYTVCIRVGNGKTVNETSYPMIRLASETDDTYEPYYEGLKELTDRGMELLWENASPDSEFAGRKITMTLNEGEVVEIAFFDSPNCRGIVGSEIVANITTCGAVDGVINYNSIREIAIDIDGITFKDALNQTRSSTTVQATKISNNVLRPYKIYRIKGVS